MSARFCDEPILRVYDGLRECAPVPERLLHCVGGIVYYAGEGYRLVLETEHYYLSLSRDGVTRDRKQGPIGTYEHSGEWLRPTVEAGEDGPDWIDLAHTLFYGERLLRVAAEEDGYLLSFDDFDARILPYDPTDAPRAAHGRLCGFERYLRPCACGGTGELFSDTVGDFFVRCGACHRATWADQTVQTAMDDWNAGRLR